MRIGENGAVSTGDVHIEKTATEIFLQEQGFPSFTYHSKWGYDSYRTRITLKKAVDNGLGAALTSTDSTPYRESTFSTIVNIPPGENAFIWLNYDTQLSRNRKHYDFSTTIFPYDAVDELEIRVDIDENKEIDSDGISKLYFLATM